MIGNIIVNTAKFFSRSTYTAIIILIAAILVCVISLIITNGNDSPVEEVAERVIEMELNLPDKSLDLHFPGHEEKK